MLKVHAGLLLPEEWSSSADQTAAFLDMVKMQDFSKLQDLTGQDHEKCCSGEYRPADARVTRMDSDVYLQAEQKRGGKTDSDMADRADAPQCGKYVGK